MRTLKSIALAALLLPFISSGQEKRDIYADPVQARAFSLALLSG